MFVAQAVTYTATPFYATPRVTFTKKVAEVDGGPFGGSVDVFGVAKIQPDGTVKQIVKTR